MATITVRGRTIRVQAKQGTQLEAVKRMYSEYTDERLDELERESNEHQEKERQEVSKAQTRALAGYIGKGCAS